MRGSRKLVSVLVVAVLLSVLFGACRRREKPAEKKDKKARKVDTDVKKPLPKKIPAIKDAESFADVFKLPAEADAVMFFDFSALRNHDAWRKTAPFFESHPLVKSISETCRLNVFTVVDRGAMAIHFHERDTLTVVEGKNLDSSQIVDCLKKAASNPALKELIKIADPSTKKEQKVEEDKKDSVENPKSGKDSQDKDSQDKDSPGNDSPDDESLDITVKSEDSVIQLRVSALGPNRIALSQGAWVGKARGFDRGEHPHLREDSHILKMKEALGGANLFWAVSLGLPPQAKSAIPGVAAAHQLRSVAFGIHGPQNTLELKLSADMRDEKSAKSLAGVLERLLPGIGKFSPDLEKIGQLIGKISISSEGPILKASLKIEEEDMKTLYGKMRGILGRPAKL